MQCTRVLRATALLSKSPELRWSKACALAAASGAAACHLTNSLLVSTGLPGLRGMAAAAKAFTVGGIGAQPSLDDVVRISQGGITLALDPAGAERVKKESPAPKSFQQESFSPADAPPTGPAPLGPQQARAVLATRLLTVMNGRSGARLQVAEYLTELLNRNVLPALPSAPTDAEVLGSLADACHGHGSSLLQEDPACSSSSGSSSTTGTVGSSLSEALAQADVTAPGLSPAERVVLSSGACAAAGIGALAVQGGKRLLTVANATVALSCEALGVQVGPGRAQGQGGGAGRSERGGAWQQRGKGWGQGRAPGVCTMGAGRYAMGLP